MKPPKISFSVIAPLTIFIILAIVLAVALTRSNQHDNKFATHIQEPVPVSHLPVMGDSASFFDPVDWKGRPYIVNFFASWCVACRAEHDVLTEIGLEHLPLIGIAVQDKPQALGPYLEKMGNPYLTIIDDAKGQGSIDWGLTGVPETFIIDAQGIIQYHAVGPVTEGMLRQDILPLWRSLKP